MSVARETDKGDFDLERFVDLFDTAMSSDHPAVKKAFKNLLLVAALTDEEDSVRDRVHGPLRRMIEDVQHLHRRIDSMDRKLASISRSFERTPSSIDYPIGYNPNITIQDFKADMDYLTLLNKIGAK